MTWLAVALALAGQPPPPVPPPWSGGRLYTSRALHVGLRPALSLDNEGDGAAIEWAAGLTLQVSVLDP